MSKSEYRKLQLINILAIACAIGSLLIGEAEARSSKSQDRIVVTEKGKTYSLPAPKGSGKTFISSGRSFDKIVKDGRRDKIVPDNHKGRKHRK